MSLTCKLAWLVLATFAPSNDVLAQSTGEYRSLHQEIDFLRDGQKAIQKDLDFIKSILTGRQLTLENVVVSTDGAPFRGDERAKVTIIEFSDYQCPFCARYMTETYPQIFGAYVKTGKVKYVFRDYPLPIHALASKAAEGARCAGEQGKFWEMHDQLFTNRQAWDGKELNIHAMMLGLDISTFQQCLETRKYSASIKKDIEQGQKAGVRATPSFFLGLSDPQDPSKVRAVEMLRGAQPYSAFRDALDKIIAQSKNDKDEPISDKAEPISKEKQVKE